MAVARRRAALGNDGSLTALHVRLAAPSVLAAMSPEIVEMTGDRMAMQGLLDDMRYGVANYRAEYAMRNLPVQIGPWRGVNHSQNAFFLECFIDELAYAAAQDPYAYRHKLLAGYPRALAALDAAANHNNRQTPPPNKKKQNNTKHETNNTNKTQVAE